MARTPFKLRSGNSPLFKQVGSSPMKQETRPTLSSKTGKEHYPDVVPKNDAHASKLRESGYTKIKGTNIYTHLASTDLQEKERISTRDIAKSFDHDVDYFGNIEE